MAGRTTAIKITGNVTEALAALEALGIKSEETAKKTEASLGGAAARTGGVFGKLGQAFQGLPFSEIFGKIDEHMSETETKGKSKFGALASVGKAAALSIAGGVAVIGTESIKAGVKFQQATAGIAASAGISTAAANKIGNAFLSTGFKTTFSAQEQATAYAQVAGQLGATEGHALSAAEAQQVMAASTDLAEASGQALGTTTAALAGVMQTYKLSTKDAASASDELYNVSRLANIPIDSLGQTVDKLKARLGDLTPSLHDVGTLMAFPSVAAMGSRGALAVSTALQTLLGGSKNTSKELKTLGVNIFDASGKFVGMRSVVAQLGPKLSGLSEAQKLAAEKTLFGASSAQLMGSVMQSGVKGYDKAAAAVGKVGSAHEAAEKQSQTFKGSVEKLKSGLEDLSVRIGGALLPILTRLGQVLADGINWLEKHKTVALILAGVIGGILVAAMIAWTVSLFAAGGALAFLMSPITLVVAAIALVALGIYELVKHWTTAWGAIKSVLNAVWNDVLKPVFDAIKFVAIEPIKLEIQGLQTIWSTSWGLIKSVLNAAWNDVIKPVFSFIKTVAIDPIQTAIGALGTAWGKIWGGIRTALSDAWGFIKPIIDLIIGGVQKAINLVTGIGSFLFGSGPKTGLQTLTNTSAIKAPTGSLGNLSSLKGIGAAGASMNLSSLSALQGHGKDLGGWTAGAPGQRSPDWVHGGEYVLSRGMMSGAQQIDPMVSGMLARNHGTPGSAFHGGTSVALTVVNGHPSSPTQLATEIGWQLKPYLTSA